jgi:hypothetical protein
MIVKNEWKNMWKEVAVAKIDVPSGNFLKKL